MILCPNCNKQELSPVYDEVDIGVGLQKYLAFYECIVCGQLPICYGCGVIEAGDWQHYEWCMEVNDVTTS